MIEDGGILTCLARICAVYGLVCLQSSSKLSRRISEDEFRLLKFDTLKLDKLKDEGVKASNSVPN